jgi:hypothetical protein
VKPTDFSPDVPKAVVWSAESATRDPEESNRLMKFCPEVRRVGVFASEKFTVVRVVA